MRALPVRNAATTISEAPSSGKNEHALNTPCQVGSRVRMCDREDENQVEDELEWCDGVLAC